MGKTKSTGRKFRRLPVGPNGGVQVLLVHPVENLGNPGDIVEVKRGFANNYLLPRGLATIATEYHRKMVEKYKLRLLQVQEAKLSVRRAMAQQLSQQSFTVEVNATEEGHLYGSVGRNEIVAALKAAGVTQITPDQVIMEGAIKELGLYSIKLNLGMGVETEIKVWVVPRTITESQKPGAKEKGK
ncbi:MAG: 50S ribosomal protein L9 [Thermoguttaceae bacterium]|nr:50S ribosomal protein L9 [Thermoguttaceae bacterium]MDW8078780.1 50S ribosomal protein L9 [Thermoguttaceae bacterium]